MSLKRWVTPVFLILISVAFLLIGIDQMRQAVDPAFEDTGSYLEGSLFIKEHGGAARFVQMCLNGEYKIANQHPLYLLLLSTFAARDLAFYPMAKLFTLAIGLIGVLVLFVIARDLYGRSTAYVATALMAFNTAILNRASHVTVEPLLILFVLLAWYFMVKGLDDNRQWVWAGLFSGLAYMSKATGVFLIPIFAIGTFIVLRWRTLRTRHFWLFFAAFGLAASPLILRNVRAFRQPFHETVNSQLPWMDHKHDLSEKHALSLKWRDHTFAAENLPTMRSYLQSHSPAVIAKRFIRGLRGESRLLLDRLSPSLVPAPGRSAAGLVVIALFAFGVARDRGRRHGLYTLVALPIFFLPFAWYFQITAETRWIVPLVPLILVHASVGIVELLKSIERRVSATRRNIPWSDRIPEALCAALIIGVAYLATTVKVRPLIHAVKLTQDQEDLMQWFGKNVSEDDVVIFRPTKLCHENRPCDHPYWGWLWYAGFKGTVIMTRRDFPIQAESLAEFRDYLRKRRVTMVVVHKANYKSPPLLDDYFDYDEQHGLMQVRDLEGWRLVYGHPGKPTRFLIFRVDTADPSAGIEVAGNARRR